MTACIKENLVEDVLAVISVNQDALNRLPASEKHGRESLQDMHVHLCELLSKMISSPLTGRVYMPTPEMYVGTKERVQSLHMVFDY